jgi:serine/threonine protein kinase
VTSTCHLHLIDFASSARLLPADEEGVQLIPKESCLVLCGTCDYISPEILAMQEEALIALDRQEEIFVQNGEGGYGRETDWWSLGTTAYELVFGVAPFFAKDIRGTYEKIMNFEVGTLSQYCHQIMTVLVGYLGFSN